LQEPKAFAKPLKVVKHAKAIKPATAKREERHSIPTSYIIDESDELFSLNSKISERLLGILGDVPPLDALKLGFSEYLIELAKKADEHQDDN